MVRIITVGESVSPRQGKSAEPASGWLTWGVGLSSAWFGTGLYFLTLALLGGVWWPAPLWMGAILPSGIVGWLVSHLAAPSLPPEEAGHESPSSARVEQTLARRAQGMRAKMTRSGCHKHPLSVVNVSEKRI